MKDGGGIDVFECSNFLKSMVGAFKEKKIKWVSIKVHVMILID